MEKKELKTTKSGKLSKILLSETEGLSFSAIFKALRNKDVKINGKRVNSDLTVNEGDVIEIYYSSTSKKDDEEVVVYSDDNVIVAYKKSGVLSETFYNELSEKYGELYFIHRLDRNTDGVMIFARNKIAEKELLQGFKYRTFDKKYLARVYGVMPKKEDVLFGYLKKNSDESEVTVTDEKVKGSVPIKTGYRVLEKCGDTSLLEVTLYTGKTHQIRAHLAHVGHFIVGDGKYGDNVFNRAKKAKSQQLTAYKLTLYFDKKSPLYYLDKKEFVVAGRVK